MLRVVVRVTTSQSACVTGSGLDPVAIAGPPGLVALRRIGPPAVSADSSINQFTNKVGVAGMASNVDDHMDQRAMKRELALAKCPPRHLTHRVRRKSIDRRVRMSPNPATRLDDAVFFSPDLTHRSPFGSPSSIHGSGSGNGQPKTE